MKLWNMVKKKSGWLEANEPFSDIVVSSRIRLARNLMDIPFPPRASADKLQDVFDTVKDAIGSDGSFKGVEIINLNDLDDVDRQFLLERHLISYEHASGKGVRGVVIGKNETLSIMINEEDHLRLQALKSGLQLDKVWEYINDIDHSLDKILTYAYSKDFGYLTACPTNTGTGLRASVLIHLPGLVLTDEIHKLLNGLSKLGLVVRGLYGEGTKIMGDFFQVSNQVTLGQTEEYIIDNIHRVVKQVIGYELDARKALLNQDRTRIEDTIFRAYGILQNAHTISFEETMGMLSKVRLGVTLELGLDIDMALLNELMILTQPAHLQENARKRLGTLERDIMRAQYIRQRLSKK